MIERGRRTIRDVDFLLRVALLLGIPPSDLRLSDDLLVDIGDPEVRSRYGPDAGGLLGPAEAVKSDQSDWKAVRGYLNQHRSALAQLAVGLYPAEVRALRPFVEEGKRFATYADVVGGLDRPALFENRTIYRLLNADFGEIGTGRLQLGPGRYFDAMSVSEALAHEFAAAAMESGDAVTLDRLPLRAAVGDPCDLSRRPMSVAITTLTLRRGRSGEASFLLHWRDPAKVTHAGGMYQVMPVGIFQPGDENPSSVGHDLNLWQSIVREFSEELLGSSEDYHRLGSPIEYERWPFFGRISEARRTGQVRTLVLGVGVDPLSLVADILAVAVFEAEVFDELFGGLVAANSEGGVVSNGGRTTGWAFTGETVQKFSNSLPCRPPVSRS